MLTIEEVKNTVNRFDVRNNKVYIKGTDREVQNEKHIMYIKSAYLLYLLANLQFEKDTIKKFKDFDEALKHTIETSTPKSNLSTTVGSLIYTLIEKGVCQRFYQNNKAEETPYIILTEAFADYGQAYIRYAMNREGIEIDECELISGENKFAKTFFFNIIVKGKRVIQYDENAYLPNDYDLNNSEEEINNISTLQTPPPIAPHQNDTEVIGTNQVKQETEPTSTTTEHDNSIDQNSITQTQETSNISQVGIDDPQIGEFNRLIEEAKTNNDLVMQTYWEEVRQSYVSINKAERIEEASIEATVIQALPPKEQFIMLDGDSLDYYRSIIEKYDSLLMNNNYDEIPNLFETIKRLRANPKFKVVSNYWESLSIEDRKLLAEVQLRSAQIVGDKIENNYWTGIYNSLETQKTI